MGRVVKNYVDADPLLVVFDPVRFPFVERMPLEYLRPTLQNNMLVIIESTEIAEWLDANLVGERIVGFTGSELEIGFSDEGDATMFKIKAGGAL